MALVATLRDVINGFWSVKVRNLVVVATSSIVVLDGSYSNDSGGGCGGKGF